jgi:predicted Co/Zn/Cd cation transporter (cation efflux family)
MLTSIEHERQVLNRQEQRSRVDEQPSHMYGYTTITPPAQDPVRQEDLERIRDHISALISSMPAEQKLDPK